MINGLLSTLKILYLQIPLIECGVQLRSGKWLFVAYNVLLLTETLQNKIRVRLPEGSSIKIFFNKKWTAQSDFYKLSAWRCEVNETWVQKIISVSYLTSENGWVFPWIRINFAIRINFHFLNLHFTVDEWHQC